MVYKLGIVIAVALLWLMKAQRPYQPQCSWCHHLISLLAPITSSPLLL
jgi:hypothetical protein